MLISHVEGICVFFLSLSFLVILLLFLLFWKLLQVGAPCRFCGKRQSVGSVGKEKYSYNGVTRSTRNLLIDEGKTQSGKGEG